MPEFYSACPWESYVYWLSLGIICTLAVLGSHMYGYIGCDCKSYVPAYILAVLGNHTVCSLAVIGNHMDIGYPWESYVHWLSLGIIFTCTLAVIGNHLHIGCPW